MAEPELPFPGDPAAEQPGFAAALREMTDRRFVASAKWQEQQQRAVRMLPGRVGAHPDLLDFERAFQRRLVRLDVPMFVHEMIRSADRQNDLFALGVTKAKAGFGPHEFGCAMDLVHCQKAWNLSKRQWAVIGHVGKEVAKTIGVRVVWGGDWNFYDPAHWELAQWKNLKGEYPWSPRK